MKIDHELQASEELGQVLGCRHADCACGPGCIHEGFVDAEEQPRSTEATEDAVLADIERELADHSIYLDRGAVKQILKTIHENKAALDFLGRM
jgi:hypothetical protein